MSEKNDPDWLSQMVSYASEIKIQIESGYYTFENRGGDWAVYDGWNSSKSYLCTGDLHNIYRWVYKHIPKWSAIGPLNRVGKKISLPR